MTEIIQIKTKDGTTRIEITTDDERIAATASMYLEKLSRCLHPDAGEMEE